MEVGSSSAYEEVRVCSCLLPCLSFRYGTVETVSKRVRNAM